MTPHGKLVCTYHYAAPEYFQGGEANAHGDQFSLGCVLYELLTGRFAFGGEEMHQIWYRITQVTPVPPSDIAFGLPESVNPIILKMLAKTPEKRYRTCGEAVTALETALANLDTSLHFKANVSSDEEDCSSFLPGKAVTVAASIDESSTDQSSDENLLKSISADSDQKTQPIFIRTKTLWWGVLIIFVVFGVFMVMWGNKKKIFKLPVSPAIDSSLIDQIEIKPETPIATTMIEEVIVRPTEQPVLTLEPTVSPTSIPEPTEEAPSSPIPVITVMPAIGDRVTPTQEEPGGLSDDVSAIFLLSPTPEKTISPRTTRTPILTPTPKKTTTPELTWTETPTPTWTSSPIPTWTSTPSPVSTTVEPTALDVIITPEIILDDITEGSDGDRPESVTEGEYDDATAGDLGADATMTPTPSATSSPTDQRKKNKREPWVPF